MIDEYIAKKTNETMRGRIRIERMKRMLEPGKSYKIKHRIKTDEGTVVRREPMELVKLYEYFAHFRSRAGINVCYGYLELYDICML